MRPAAPSGRPHAARRVPPALILVAAAACSPTPDAAGRFAFAVVGDTPYSEANERLFPVLTRQVGEADVDFVIHIGDLKWAGTPCTDSLLAARINALDGFGHPLVYVPGDNDWTDCHREPPGAFAPLERLAFLRRQAYPVLARSRGTAPMDVESQATEGAPEFPEHQRWSQRGVVFATVHAVGSRNGLVPFPTRTVEDDLEVDRRVEAAVAWLGDTFARARDQAAAAVVIAMQANPWDFPEGYAERTGFEEILAALREEAEAFGRPVLLIHGDTHMFRVDRPYWSEYRFEVPNLMRLETYGAPDVGWVEVHVDPDSPGVFGFTPRPVSPP